LTGVGRFDSFLFRSEPQIWGQTAGSDRDQRRRSGEADAAALLTVDKLK
jgi:hypothetical protein